MTNVIRPSEKISVKVWHKNNQIRNISSLLSEKMY